MNLRVKGRGRWINVSGFTLQVHDVWFRGCDQKSEIRNQKSGIRNQESGMKDQGTMILVYNSTFQGFAFIM
jgi:hypothetical protein